MDDAGVLIEPAAPDDPALLHLVARHGAWCRAVTPAGSGHAVAPDTRETAALLYWLAVKADAPIGCIGLRLLADGTAEIKSLHVVEAARGAGAADALIAKALDAAREHGAGVIVLETGRNDAFAPSRRVYARYGFAPIPAFGPYIGDPFSYCMGRPL